MSKRSSVKRSYVDTLLLRPTTNQIKKGIMEQLGTPAMRAALRVLQEQPLLHTNEFNALIAYAVQNLCEPCRWQGPPPPNVQARLLRALDSAERTLWPPPFPQSEQEISAARMPPEQRRRDAANATMLAVLVYVGRHEMHAKKEDANRKINTTLLISRSIRMVAPDADLFDTDVIYNTNTLFQWWTF